MSHTSLMKNFLRVAALGFCFVVAQAFAGTGPSIVETSTKADDDIPAWGFEFDLHGSYVGDGDIKRGSRRIEDFDELNALARFVILPRTPIGLLRIGAEYEIFDFGFGDGLQVPDRLQSIAAIIGLDTKFSDNFLVRFEAKPGVYYTDHADSKDWNIPFILGGTYLYSSDFQWIFGVSVDLGRQYPVLPGGGFRWRFAPQWVLNAAAPTPRLEYELTRNFMIFAGADLRGKAVRVDENFVGDLPRPEKLNNAVLSYLEIRTGLGVQWKIGDTCKLTVDGGYLPYREFDYHRADVRYKADGGSIYGGVTFGAKF